MSPEETIGRLIVTVPAVQIALVLGGVLLLWYVIRSIRKALNAASALTDRRAAIDLCNNLIAVRAKALVGGAVLIQFGVCLLLSSAKIFSAEIALSLMAILVVTTVIPAIVYFMFWGVPAPLLHWFLADLAYLQQISPDAIARRYQASANFRK